MDPCSSFMMVVGPILYATSSTLERLITTGLPAAMSRKWKSMILGWNGCFPPVDMTACSEGLGSVPSVTARWYGMEIVVFHEAWRDGAWNSWFPSANFGPGRKDRDWLNGIKGPGRMVNGGFITQAGIQHTISRFHRDSKVFFSIGVRVIDCFRK